MAHAALALAIIPFYMPSPSPSICIHDSTTPVICDPVSIFFFEELLGEAMDCGTRDGSAKELLWRKVVT
jgi:hypothetical protein